MNDDCSPRSYVNSNYDDMNIYEEIDGNGDANDLHETSHQKNSSPHDCAQSMIHNCLLWSVVESNERIEQKLDELILKTSDKIEKSPTNHINGSANNRFVIPEEKKISQNEKSLINVVRPIIENSSGSSSKILSISRKSLEQQISSRKFSKNLRRLQLLPKDAPDDLIEILSKNTEKLNNFLEPFAIQNEYGETILYESKVNIFNPNNLVSDKSWAPGIIKIIFFPEILEIRYIVRLVNDLDTNLVNEIVNESIRIKSFTTSTIPIRYWSKWNEKIETALVWDVKGPWLEYQKKIRTIKMIMSNDRVLKHCLIRQSYDIKMALFYSNFGVSRGNYKVLCIQETKNLWRSGIYMGKGYLAIFQSLHCNKIYITIFRITNINDLSLLTKTEISGDFEMTMSNLEPPSKNQIVLEWLTNSKIYEACSFENPEEAWIFERIIEYYADVAKNRFSIGNDWTIVERNS